nr:uncharacterized protein LOC109193865 [Ipomoea batatas]
MQNQHGVEADKNGANLGGGANGASVSKGKAPNVTTSPYDPRMIATRRERRAVGWPIGQGRTVEKSGQEDNLVVLAEDNVATQVVEDNPEEPLPTSGALPAATLSTTQGGRSRRANVIVNEKLITNDPTIIRDIPVTETTPPSSRRQSKKTPKRAAEEDEHVVVLVENGGTIINSSRVHNGEPNAEVLGINGGIFDIAALSVAVWELEQETFDNPIFEVAAFGIGTTGLSIEIAQFVISCFDKLELPDGAIFMRSDGAAVEFTSWTAGCGALDTAVCAAASHSCVCAAEACSGGAPVAACGSGGMAMEADAVR